MINHILENIKTLSSDVKLLTSQRQSISDEISKLQNQLKYLNRSTYVKNQMSEEDLMSSIFHLVIDPDEMSIEQYLFDLVHDETLQNNFESLTNSKIIYLDSTIDSEGYPFYPYENIDFEFECNDQTIYLNTGRSFNSYDPDHLEENGYEIVEFYIYIKKEDVALNSQIDQITQTLSQLKASLFDIQNKILTLEIEIDNLVETYNKQSSQIANQEFFDSLKNNGLFEVYQKLSQHPSISKITYDFIDLEAIHHKLIHLKSDLNRMYIRFDVKSSNFSILMYHDRLTFNHQYNVIKPVIDIFGQLSNIDKFKNVSIKTLEKAHELEHDLRLCRALRTTETLSKKDIRLLYDDESFDENIYLDLTQKLDLTSVIRKLNKLEYLKEYSTN